LASVRVRKDTGLLFLDFRWNGRRYREQTALIDSPENRARLEKVLARIQKQIEQNTFDHTAFFRRPPNGTDRSATSDSREAPRTASLTVEGMNDLPLEASALRAVPTFQQFAEQWLREHAVEWRRSHARTLDSTVERHLVPRFGDLPISEIRKADILAFRAELARLPGRGKRPALSNKRINGIIGPLKQILNEAAERYEFQPPTVNIRALKLRRTDVFPFTLEEVERILGTVRSDYRDYLMVRFFTGLRSGEVDGLKWKYIDFTSRLILIRETRVLGADDYTKTDGSQRDIQMCTPVYDALRRQEAVSRHRGEYVFCNQVGRPVDNKNFTERVWDPLLRHLELPPRRPYQMRHTAATLWLAAGESPEWIARQLGHTNTQMLFRVYSRYVPNLTRKDGSAMERLLASAFKSSAHADSVDPPSPSET
jgi:integrase